MSIDQVAFRLSLELAAWTLAILLPFAILAGRWLAAARFTGKGMVEALVALPLVLPPTVLGYYLIVAFGADSWLGDLYGRLTDRSLVFSFDGLLVASVIFNLPFAIQPIQRAYEAIPLDVRQAAACCGMSARRAFLRVELPLAWPGIVSAAALTFAHTLGEFGVVLMVGGSIPGETRTIAIAIYDSLQALDTDAAGAMSALLLVLSLGALALVYGTSRRVGRRRG